MNQLTVADLYKIIGEKEVALEQLRQYIAILSQANRDLAEQLKEAQGATPKAEEEGKD